MPRTKRETKPPSVGSLASESCQEQRYTLFLVVSFFSLEGSKEEKESRGRQEKARRGKPRNKERRKGRRTKCRGLACFANVLCGVNDDEWSRLRTRDPGLVYSILVLVAPRLPSASINTPEGRFFPSCQRRRLDFFVSARTFGELSRLLSNSGIAAPCFLEGRTRLK